MLSKNDAAEKTIQILIELIKSGRYRSKDANPDPTIDALLKEADSIKKKIEELYQ